MKNNSICLTLPWYWCDITLKKFHLFPGDVYMLWYLLLLCLFLLCDD
jgi:hypothetical protein